MLFQPYLPFPLHLVWRCFNAMGVLLLSEHFQHTGSHGERLLVVGFEWSPEVCVTPDYVFLFYCILILTDRPHSDDFRRESQPRRLQDLPKGKAKTLYRRSSPRTVILMVLKIISHLGLSCMFVFAQERVFLSLLYIVFFVFKVMNF